MSNPFENEQGDKATAEAMDDPRIGDRFSEFYSFWLYVVDRDGDHITTMEASPPCEFPKDAKLAKYSLVDFRKRFAYGSIPGYSIRLVDRGNDVSGWIS